MARALSVKQIEEMQKGRAEGLAVRKYLLALSGETPQVKHRDISKQLAKIKEDLDICTNPLQRVKLLQRQYDLVNGKEETEKIIDLAALEREFIAVLPGYSKRSGISKEVWMQSGVPTEVLAKAKL